MVGKKVRVGVIGAGRIGRIHTKNLVQKVEKAEVTVICDPRYEETKEWARSLGIERIVTDPMQVINDPEIDAIIICSPTNTHADLIIASARAKKDIFCEKPIDMDLEKTKKALEVVKEEGVKLQIGFNRRFDHNFRKIRSMVEEGKIGDVHVVNITSRDPAPPPIEYVKVSGGIFMDMTIHDFDMARYLVGDEVVEVYASGSVLIDPKIGKAGDFDTTATILKFRNGATCIIDNSRKAAYGYDQRVEVFGSKGCARAENDTETNVIFSNEECVASDKPLYFFLERYMQSFEDEMHDFVDALLYGRKIPVSGHDGLMAIVIARAATISARENRPVKIEEVL
ncbi:inositol 2-dehydrogenase [Kosmotoga pacifica]|uniref:Oxidoreductase n=1 Tax=Kosmotoga pacifica TaxID=1330330 RepID=A0A0G2Z739_9BACT|nr:inositol 2-dehydrogenase [Kosmotoga pacifica]AKI97420.1 oxidoreductase [Kosmotoga pacifica]